MVFQITIPPKSVVGDMQTKPFLKWAGGKTQLLKDLMLKVPDGFGSYIEPFVGGGAMFFALRPQNGILADSNPELINAYKAVANKVERVIEHLKTFRYDEQEYYKIRSLNFTSLESTLAAARTIYLNRTCYNGLYRVNRKGQFNVPYGKHKNPNICMEDTLIAASAALRGTKIIHGDYKDVLCKYAREGDFIFLDPPYMPVSKHSDFKRYTKEQFYLEDHVELAEEVRRLQGIGCHVLLTNSNHPLVHELYGEFNMEIIDTRRNISSKEATRKGKDVMVQVLPNLKLESPKPTPVVNKRALSYPPTRYMGSKEKVLPYIQCVAERFEFNSVLDLFSGSGVVGYMFKTMGKQVTTNDYMVMNATFSEALIANNSQTLDPEEVDSLFIPGEDISTFVQDTFSNIYYSDEENAMIDIVRANIKKLSTPVKKAIAMSALVRACLKKRARGVFTYTGLRYDDGRADLRMSLEEQVRNATDVINNAVFDNGQHNQSLHGDAMDCMHDADLIYIDPPYYSPLSDNEYVRRYHFVEGLARYWEGVDMQWHTKTRKFKNYPTPFTSKAGAEYAFQKLFERYKTSILLVSYSSNSLPTKQEIIGLMSQYKEHVDVIDIDYKYSFANKKSNARNDVKEYLFVGY